MVSVRPFNLFAPLAYVWVTPPGWQKAVRAIVNSMYYESLEAKAKQRYREKLFCLGLPIHDDLYLGWRRSGLLALVQSCRKFPKPPILGCQPRRTNSFISADERTSNNSSKPCCSQSHRRVSKVYIASRNLYFLAFCRIGYSLRSETCYQLTCNTLRPLFVAD